MAREGKPRPLVAGAAFAILLADGRFAACRVLRESADDGHARVLVAASAWIGDAIPDVGDPSLRPILRKTHHAWEGQPEVIWVDDEVPSRFIPIGTIEPTPDERSISCAPFGSWESAALQPLLQWRWDHDRAAVLAEDAIKAQAEAARRSEERAERAAYLARVTLDELSRRQFFPDWEYPPAAATDASRAIMAATVTRLIGLGPDASEADQMAVLQRCIESFNELDADERLIGFIETVEREDICEEFEAIVHACGLGHHEDLADEWRDW